MTEAEWLACENPTPMLDAVSGRGTERKLRLFNVVCCYTVWDFLVDERSQEVVRVAEEFADGQTTEEKLSSSTVEALNAYRELDIALDRHCHESEEFTSRFSISTAALLSATSGGQAEVGGTPISPSFGAVLVDMVEHIRLWDLEATSGLAHSLRDIFGNPFRPVVADPLWFTSTVVALAEGIYQDRAFDRMPILADALQDAGCDNDAILTHCRQPGEHVRGCWVVDVLTGRK